MYGFWLGSEDGEVGNTIYGFWLGSEYGEAGNTRYWAAIFAGGGLFADSPCKSRRCRCGRAISYRLKYWLLSMSTKVARALGTAGRYLLFLALFLKLKHFLRVQYYTFDAWVYIVSSSTVWCLVLCAGMCVGGPPCAAGSSECSEQR